MFESVADMQGKFYAPLTEIWVERIKAAQTAKARFTKIGNTCNEFYESQAGSMWKNKDFFNGKLPSPRFAINIAKAFEFVSIYGPSLFWRYADRKVMSQRTFKLEPEFFGDPNDPQAQQMAAQVMTEEASESAMANFGNSLMSNVLNWTQREQPGGLVTHGQAAVTESLIKGMGVLWPETYTFPGSEAKYTKLTQDSVDNLFVDPDCKDPLWETAGYIIRQHTNPIWQVERMFNLKRGTLTGKGNQLSSEMQARKNASHANPNNSKDTFDLITWHEIWSKVGVGPRTGQVNHHAIDMFDQELGDYAYLCIADGVKFPLNAPPDKFFEPGAATSDDIKTMFQWRCANYGDPFPAYKDNRWPVSRLWYNPIMNSPWPLAPLAPGLGELIALNVLTSSYIDQAWSNRQLILAHLKSAAADVEDALKSDEQLVHIGLNDNIHSSINNVIQFLQRPTAQGDQLRAMEMLAQQFNDRVGLSELQYGASSTQIRVAADARQKSEAVSVRPEKMSGDVAKWMTDASQLEMFLAAMHIKGQDLVHLLGGFGASQWDRYFGEMPIEQLMREAKATVEASEVRRPNKERDTANMQSMQQYLLPLLQALAQQTGDTKPLNEFLERMAESMEMKPITELPPWQPPPPDEEAQQMAQATQMASLEKIKAEAEHKQAAAQKAITDAAVTLSEAENPTGVIGEMKHQQELRHKEELHQQQMMQDEGQYYQQLLFDDLLYDQNAQQKASTPAGSNK